MTSSKRPSQASFVERGIDGAIRTDSVDSCTEHVEKLPFSVKFTMVS